MIPLLPATPHGCLESEGVDPVRLKVWFSGSNGAPVEEGASDTPLLDVALASICRQGSSLPLLESFPA